ncbi:hypothetical protein H7N52_002599 [Staphylococcus pseudintermedius]|nr:hypothetical protein [Staphylococcus pseudintermedius]
MEFNRSKINELINKFNSLGLTYLDESSHDAQTETELTNSKTEFILYCELFNELIKPLFQKNQKCTW